jgi:3-dehydroquinate synthase II
VIADRLILRFVGGDGSSLTELGKEAHRRGFRRSVLPPGVDLALLPLGTVAEKPDRFEEGRPPGAVLFRERLAGPEDLERVAGRLERGESVAVRFEAERVLPLERLIARRPRGVQLWVEVANERELSAALGALEHGADAAVIDIADLSALEVLASQLEPDVESSPALSLLRVTRVSPMGNGERVLVDTTSLLGPAEGLLTGSSAGWLFLLLSEAVGSRVTRPRPFRVNAGAPHSYTLLASGETRYLSELEAGDQLLAVGPASRARSVRVGRLKIERRPMLLVEVETPKGKATLFVQEAETVRLQGESSPRPVTELKMSDRVLVAELPPARHLGQSISEFVEER